MPKNVDAKKMQTELTTGIQHTLRDQGSKLADLFIDVVSSTSLDSIVTFSSPSSFLVGENGLLGYRVAIHTFFIP